MIAGLWEKQDGQFRALIIIFWGGGGDEACVDSSIASHIELLYRPASSAGSVVPGLIHIRGAAAAVHTFAYAMKIPQADICSTVREKTMGMTYVTAVQAARFAHDTGTGSLETATEMMIRETAQATASRRATTMTDEWSGCMQHGCCRSTGSPFRAACRCRPMYNRPSMDWPRGQQAVCR